MPLITVLTPTYNRSEELKKLYASLLRQTDNNFKWLIVDDGSADDTENVVSAFCNENKDKRKFEIQYVKKENGGKHTALNYAYDFIDTALTFIVDSDDSLTDDAVATITNTYEAYKGENDLCAFSFLRITPDGKRYLSPKLPQDNMKSTYCDCRVDGDLVGDMAEVWFTHCLKEFPFPTFENERFLGEDTVWVKMSGDYKIRFFNKAIYISEYLDTGLTNNRRLHNIKSPNGCVERARVFLQADINLKNKLKCVVQYIIYSRFAGIGTKEQYRLVPTKPLYLATYIPANMLYILWNKKYI